MTTRPWNRGSIDLDWLSGVYVDFFKGEPWNEYLYCPKCKPANDFGPNHTWGDGELGPEGCCPDCGSKLELFWGEDRLEYYLFDHHPGSEGFVVECNGKVAGWQMGYPLDGKRFYVDLIAILPEYRRDPGLEAFLSVFRGWIASKAAEGYAQIWARTHKEARRVRLLFRWIGFVEGQASGDDADRTYWTLNC